MFGINKEENLIVFSEIYNKVVINSQFNKLYQINTITKMVVGEDSIEYFEDLKLMVQYQSLITIINKLLRSYSSNQIIWKEIY